MPPVFPWGEFYLNNTKPAQRQLVNTWINALPAYEKDLFDAIVENVGPLLEWPPRKMALLVCDHLLAPMRFELTLFLLGNQCPPNLYAEWLLKRGMLRDEKARYSVAELIKKHKANKLATQTTYHLPFRLTTDLPPAKRRHTWDGVGDPWPDDASRMLPVEGPTAVMHEEGWRWDQAYAVLTNKSQKILPWGSEPMTVKIVPEPDPDEYVPDVPAVRMVWAQSSRGQRLVNKVLNNPP